MNPPRNASQPIGSEFAWPDAAGGPHSPWPADAVFFMRGRDAVLGLWKAFASGSSRLYAPDYFCESVTDTFLRANIPIAYYRDGPERSAPDFSTLPARRQDFILAVNYFGVRNGECWRRWRRDHDVTLIEDHTHDPLSTWAKNSTADYAFASLRKVTPVPDGAMLWSPRKLQSPAPPTNGDWTGSALKFAGMVFKREHLAEPETSLSWRTYRQWEIDGEERLEAEGGAISPWSFALLAAGYPVAWRRRREENAKQFLRRYSQSPQGAVAPPLFVSWPNGHCPLNPVLLFPDEAARQRCRRFLIEQQVFAPIHWRLTKPGSDEATGVSQRVLTIPLDHRCQEDDIARVVECLNEVPQRKLAASK